MIVHQIYKMGKILSSNLGSLKIVFIENLLQKFPFKCIDKSMDNWIHNKDWIMFLLLVNQNNKVLIINISLTMIKCQIIIRWNKIDNLVIMKMRYRIK